MKLDGLGSFTISLIQIFDDHIPLVEIDSANLMPEINLDAVCFTGLVQKIHVQERPVARIDTLQYGTSAVCDEHKLNSLPVHDHRTADFLIYRPRGVSFDLALEY